MASHPGMKKSAMQEKCKPFFAFAMPGGQGLFGFCRIALFGQSGKPLAGLPLANCLAAFAMPGKGRDWLASTVFLPVSLQNRQCPCF
jgi:hypothetical protein